jgi:single-stranded-DNA-specific exonuclease
VVTRPRWLVRDPIDAATNSALADFPPVVRNLLANRGVRSAAAADLYLSADHRLVGNPLAIPDMEKAAARVRKALEAGEQIGVYGDYDADGVTSCALLVEALRALGSDPVMFLPHRIQDGYGVGERGLRYLAENGATLVISADCGISGVNGNAPVPPGVDLIVTDHHIPPPQLPDVFAAVDPVRTDSVYPWPELAGVGVAFKLMQAVYQSLGRSCDESLLEYVAIGTVADVAPLVGENRYLVRAGLGRLRTSNRFGIVALAQQARRNLPQLDEEAIGFGLGPRINAAGRMAHADLGLRLLLSTNETDAMLLANELEGLNTKRRQLTQEVVDRARKTVIDGGEIPPVILLGGDAFPAGIVGLAAGRLAEEFNRPAIVYQQDGDQVRASARSIQGFDITSALETCRSLLSSHGGHHQAAGFSAPLDNISELHERLIAIAGELLSEDDLLPSIQIDVETPPSALPGEVMGHLARMAPFGAGNPTPVYVARGLEVRSLRTMGAGREHLRLTLREPERRVTWDAVAWRQGERAKGPLGSQIDIVYRLQPPGGQSRYSRGALELEVLDLRSSGEPR